MSDTATARPTPWGLAIFLVITGAIGWLCAFALTLDKFAVLENPQADLDCNISVIVQCGTNLQSWQGSLLGFPNPILGLGGFAAVIAVGVGLLAGARFARWFWILFNVGILGAFALVVFLIITSIYVISSLCPYCMVVWIVTIPLFLVVTARNLKEGVFGRGRRLGWFVLSWIAPISVVIYLAIALLAQLRLDWIGTL